MQGTGSRTAIDGLSAVFDDERFEFLACLRTSSRSISEELLDVGCFYLLRTGSEAVLAIAWRSPRGR